MLFTVESEQSNGYRLGLEPVTFRLTHARRLSLFEYICGISITKIRIRKELYCSAYCVQDVLF